MWSAPKVCVGTSVPEWVCESVCVFECVCVCVRGALSLGDGGRRRRAPPCAAGGPGPRLGRPRSLLLARGRAGLAGLGSGCGAAPGQEAESSSAAAAAAGLCLYRSPVQAAESGPLRAETAGRGARTAGAEVSPAAGRARRGGGRGVQTSRGETPPPRPATPRAPESSSRSPTPDSDPGSLPFSRLWPGASFPPAVHSPSRASRDPTPLPSPRGAPLPPRGRTPRTPHFLGPGISSPRLGRSLLPWLHFGVRAPAGREWPSVPAGTRAEAPALRGWGRTALRTPGAGRAPWFPPRRGARPGNSPRPGTRPTLGQKPAQSWPVCPPRLQKGAGPGGGRGASPVAHRRAQQAGRSLLSKTPGWSSRRPASLCPRRPGWRQSHRLGAAFATGRTSFPPAGFKLPQANVSGEV